MGYHHWDVKNPNRYHFIYPKIFNYTILIGYFWITRSPSSLPGPSSIATGPWSPPPSRPRRPRARRCGRGGSPQPPSWRHWWGSSPPRREWPGAVFMGSWGIFCQEKLEPKWENVGKWWKILSDFELFGCLVPKRYIPETFWGRRDFWWIKGRERETWDR